MKRRIITLLSVLGLMLSVVVGLPQQASAYRYISAKYCSDGTWGKFDELVRGAQARGSKTYIYGGRGVTGSMYAWDRNVNPACLPGSSAQTWGGEYFGSGVKMLFSDSSGKATTDYVFLGWHKFNNPSTGRDAFDIYMEWKKKNGSTASYHCNTWACAQAAAGGCQFRLTNIDNSTKWDALIRCPGVFDNWENMFGVDTGYNRGFPQSVTYRYGGTKTGMRDAIWNLQYRALNGEWRSFENSGAYRNTTKDWGFSSVTENSYQVTKK